MFTVDIIALMDRLNKLENESRELRELLTKTTKDIYDAIEDTRQTAVDAMPEVKDGKLVFESYDAKGDTVYGHVVAEIVSDQALAE